MTKNNNYRLKVKKILCLTISLCFKLFMFAFFAFPFFWMVSTAFKNYKESIRFPPTLLPSAFNTSAFMEVAEKINLFYYLKNSILVSTIVVILQLLINIPAAYGFARFEFKGKRLMWLLVMVSFMIPLQLTFIPVYIMFAKAKLLDTLLPQILPFAANAYGIFLMRQSFMQMPKELMEAARIDGAGELTILLKVVIPMSKNSIVTAHLFSFISMWNSYFWPLVMTNSDKIRPLPLAMQRLEDTNQGLNWPILMAANTVLVLPILILFLFLSKQILDSLGYKGDK